jgi:YebC/PmpR family DNA-binding regulatory protein
LLIELSTDNRNRTASQIRSLLTKNGGMIATGGSVTRLFQRKGQIIVARETAAEDAVMEVALEAGAEDFKTDADAYEILTDPSHFESVHKAIEAKGIKPVAAEVTWLPTLTVPLGNEKAVEETNRLIDLLEEDDDVKEVHSNAEFTD